MSHNSSTMEVTSRFIGANITWMNFSKPILQSGECRFRSISASGVCWVAVAGIWSVKKWTLALQYVLEGIWWIYVQFSKKSVRIWSCMCPSFLTVNWTFSSLKLEIWFVRWEMSLQKVYLISLLNKLQKIKSKQFGRRSNAWSTCLGVKSMWLTSYLKSAISSSVGGFPVLIGQCFKLWYLFTTAQLSVLFLNMSIIKNKIN